MAFKPTVSECLRSSQHDLGTAGWFGIPALPRPFVRRPRLYGLLEGSDRFFVLVSGPAGSGKTSLVADWVVSRCDADRTEWITFEGGDEVFWPGVATSLERLGVDVPPEFALPPQRCAPDRQLLTALAAAVADQPFRMTLVVDGYELVSAEIAEGLDFLLRHCGHRLRIVFLTRADPVLPLYRYRLEDTLAEVRMADLAFTDSEAQELLSAAGVVLAPESVHALNARTEGWAAGLRFASTFLGEREDPDGAIADVVGDTGNIAEYLMGEVLAVQTTEGRDLLLNTSIPETLRPGLTEVLGGPSATRRLALLARDNAFVEPLAEHPGCYRYHPFFRDLLRAELGYEAPDQMRHLQRKTADWFAHEGLLTAAVSHYVAIDAWAEAAGQVVDDLAIGELLLDAGDNTLAQAMRPIPDEVQAPAAAVVRATLALADADTDRFQDQLAQVPEPAQGSAVSLAVAVLRAVRARSSADTREAIELAEAAELALYDGKNRAKVGSHPELMALVYASKGIATLHRGQLCEAHDLFTAGVGAARGRGSEALLAECLGYLAVIACLRCQLSKAASLAVRAIGLAEAQHVRATDRPSAAQVALAWVRMDQYQLESAVVHLKLADTSVFRDGDLVTRMLLVIVRSRLQAARGDVAGAIASVGRATGGLPDPGSWLGDLLRIEAAHLRAMNGEARAAVSEVEGIEERQPAEVALVVARARLEEGDDTGCGEALSQVLVRDTSLEAQVSGWLVEASRQLHRGCRPNARTALQRSVRLAAREGLRRPILEAGAGVTMLLDEDPELRADTVWLETRRQSSGARGPAQRVPSQRIPSGRPATSPEDEAPVVGSLTKKEFEVLNHLAELLTTEEIAGTMFVSVNTVRTHVRSILRKLGVSRRNAAVRRARELDLLGV